MGYNMYGDKKKKKKTAEGRLNTKMITLGIFLGIAAAAVCMGIIILLYRYLG